MSWSDQFREVYDEQKQKLCRNLRLFAEQIGTDSNDFTPIDTGDLRNSYTVNPPFITRTGCKVTFGYDREYSIKQHEDLLAHFERPPIRRGFADIAEGGTAARGSKYARGYRKAGAHLPGYQPKYRAKFLEKGMAETEKFNFGLITDGV